MALYTSYYAKQLALVRPEAAQGYDVNVEGERTIHKAVARRTIDLSGPYTNWFEVSEKSCDAGFCIRRDVTLALAGRRDVVPVFA